MTRLVADNGGIMIGGAAQVGSVGRDRADPLLDQLAGMQQVGPGLEDQLDRRQLRAPTSSGATSRPCDPVERLLERHGDERLDVLGREARGRRSGSRPAAGRTRGTRPPGCRAPGRTRRRAAPRPTPRRGSGTSGSRRRSPGASPPTPLQPGARNGRPGPVIRLRPRAPRPAARSPRRSRPRCRRAGLRTGPRRRPGWNRCRWPGGRRHSAPGW